MIKVNSINAIILIILSLVMSTSRVQAQDPLSQTYITPDGTLVFNYPENWLLKEYSGEDVLITNDRATIAVSPFDQAPLEATQVLMALVTPADAARAIEDRIINTPLEFVTLLAEDSDYGPGEPAEIDGLKYPAARLPLENIRGRDSVFLIADVGDGEFAGFLLQTANDELATFEPLALEILESIRYTPPPPPVIAGVTLWEFRQPIAEIGAGPDSFAEPGDVVVGADDTIYVTDGNAAINVFSPDGQFLREIPILDDPEAIIDDVAVSRDGSLWVAVRNTNDNNSSIMHLSAEGSLISSFSIEPPEEDWSADGLIEFDSEGYLYVVDSLIAADITMWESRIRVLDSDGNVVREFQSSTRLGESTNRMTLASDGNLYLRNNANFYVLDNTGHPVNDLTFPLRGMSTMFAIGPEGSIYIKVRGGPLMVFNSKGDYLYEMLGTESPTSSDSPPPPLEDEKLVYLTGMACLSNGDLIVADHNEEEIRIMRISFATQ